MELKIQLIDNSQQLCNYWSEEFKNYKNVIVHKGDFFSLPTDCVVSPANSFGFMDGGLDAYITNKLGNKVQLALQDKINKYFNGELLVGQAVIVYTHNDEIPNVISAPTMRVPMILPKDTINPYLATKAILNCVINNNNLFSKINTITIPGLGTGVGRVDYAMCARQMRIAYEDIFVNEIKFPNSWRSAQLKHMDLYSPNKII